TIRREVLAQPARARHHGGWSQLCAALLAAVRHHLGGSAAAHTECGNCGALYDRVLRRRAAAAATARPDAAVAVLRRRPGAIPRPSPDLQLGVPPRVDPHEP